MLRKALVAAMAVAAISTCLFVSQAAEAGGCTVLSVKGRGIDEATASPRSIKHLTFKINHWAHKNKIGTVRVGHRSTTCNKKIGLSVCVSSAKVCG